jgi:hypothetical protein
LALNVDKRWLNAEQHKIRDESQDATQYRDLPLFEGEYGQSSKIGADFCSGKEHNRNGFNS